MDDVAAAGAQDARGLAHDGALGFLSLHGEHGFADDDVCALIRQAGLRGVGVHAAPHARGDGVHARGGVRIALHADVGGGAHLDDRGGRDAQAGRELDDVRTGQHGTLEGPRAEGEAAGAQHRLSGARKDPVAGRLLDGPVGEGKGLRRRFTVSCHIRKYSVIYFFTQGYTHIKYADGPLPLDYRPIISAKAALIASRRSRACSQGSGSPSATGRITSR